MVAGSGALRVRGISLLGGRIRIDRAVVGSRASVSGVTVDGRPAGRLEPCRGRARRRLGARAAARRAAAAERQAPRDVGGGAPAPDGAAGRLPAGSEVLIGLATGVKSGVNLAGVAKEIPVDLCRSTARRRAVRRAVVGAGGDQPRRDVVRRPPVRVRAPARSAGCSSMPRHVARLRRRRRRQRHRRPVRPRRRDRRAANQLNANGAASNLRTPSATTTTRELRRPRAGAGRGLRERRRHRAGRRWTPPARTPPARRRAARAFSPVPSGSTRRPASGRSARSISSLETWQPRSDTTRTRSRSSRASTRCASARACTSAARTRGRSTTWSGRSSTTRSTRRSPGTAPRST